jgi:peroxiredoxin
MRLSSWAILLLAGVMSAQTIRQPVPRLSLEEMTGRTVQYRKLAGKVTVVVFVSTRCPISNAFNFRLNSLYLQFHRQVRFIVIDSNTNESLEEIRVHAKNMDYDFPVYRDIDSSAADAFGAKATPDSFVLDKQGKMSYHGYIEDGVNPQRTKTPALRLAIEAALHGKPAPFPETHARGCAIRRSKPGPAQSS